jgi:hypothetical protein
MPRRRWVESRRAALAEHPGSQYLGGGLVWLPDGHVARCLGGSNREIDERRRENLAALERMAAELRPEERPRRRTSPRDARPSA